MVHSHSSQVGGSSARTTRSTRLSAPSAQTSANDPPGTTGPPSTAAPSQRAIRSGSVQADHSSSGGTG